MNKVRNVDNNILNHSDSVITEVLLFGDHRLSNDLNALILNASVEYILATGRFDSPLF